MWQFVCFNILDKFDFSEFAEGAGKIGIFFFFLYMVFISFILINFFLTILCEAFSQVKAEWTFTNNEYEIVEYVTMKFKRIFGYVNSAEQGINLERRFQYLEGWQCFLGSYIV